MLKVSSMCQFKILDNMQIIENSSVPCFITFRDICATSNTSISSIFLSLWLTPDFPIGGSNISPNFSFDILLPCNS